MNIVSPPLYPHVYILLYSIHCGCIHAVLSLMLSISRCTEIWRCTQYIILYSCHNTTHTLSFFSRNLFWYGRAFFMVPHPVQDTIPLPPVFGTCKQFQFFPFCSSAVFCLLSCMGRVFYLLPSSIWVDVPSLTNVWNTHQDLSSHFTKEGRGILYISARGYVAGYLIRYANIVPRTRLLENPVRGYNIH